MGLFGINKKEKEDNNKDMAKKIVKKVIAAIIKIILPILIKILIGALILYALVVAWNIIQDKFFDVTIETVRVETNGSTTTVSESQVREIQVASTSNPIIRQADENIAQLNTENYNNQNSSVMIDEDKREYVINTEFTEKVNKELGALFLNPKAVGLTDKLLIKMYQSEIMTSYPDLRTRNKIGKKIDKDEIQGAIQFRRKYEDGTEETLEYMEFDEFRTELAKFGCDLPDSEGNSINVEKKYTSKSEVDAKYKELRRYFTLDKEYNAIVATLSSNEIKTTHSNYAKEEQQQDSYSYTYNVEIKKINYKSSVGKYAMPIELPLSLLLVTENPGFCDAVLDLARDTKIVIEVQDNLSTTNRVEKYDYVGNFELEKKIKYYTWKLKVKIGDSTDTGSDTEDNQTNRNDSNSGEGQNSNDNQSSLIPNVDLSQIPPNPDYPDNPSDLISDIDWDNLHTDTQDKNSSLFPNIHFEWVKEYGESNPKGTYTKEKNMDNPYTKTVTNIENIMTYAFVVEAQTWFADIKVEYQKVTEGTGNNSEDVIFIDDDTEYLEVQDYHNLLDTLEEELPKLAIVEEETSSIKEKKTNQELRMTTSTSDIKYNKVNTTITQREEKFLSLLATNIFGEFDKEKSTRNIILKKYRDISGKRTSPEESLLNYSKKLFEFLRKNEESQACEEIMRYLLYVYTGKSYGVTELDFSIYEPDEFTGIGGQISSVFGCNISKQDFIQAIQKYEDKVSSNRRDDYRNYMIPYAADFYDVCAKNNINPMFAFAHSCLETGYGSNSGCKRDKNYFGYAHYNGNNSGSSYSSVSDSIQDYCNWIIRNATGTAANANNNRAQELAPYAPELNGTADTNVYVLFCRYAQLDATHDASNNIGNPRIFMRQVYNIQCNHSPNAPTSTEEKAKYAVYTTKTRLDIANNIFGEYSTIVGGTLGGIETSGVESEGYTQVYTSYANGRTFKVYRQFLYPNTTYGTIDGKPATIAQQGCPVVATATILSGYGINKNPAQLINGGTLQYINFINMIRSYGINCTEPISVNMKQELVSALQQGKTAIIYIKAASDYTDNQHYMALLGLSEDGTQVYVGNPSRKNCTGYNTIDNVLKGAQYISIIG